MLPGEALSRAQALARRFQEEEALRLFILRHLYVVGPAVVLSFCLSLGAVAGATLLGMHAAGPLPPAVRWLALALAAAAIAGAMALQLYVIFAWAERRSRAGEGARFDREWGIAALLLLVLAILVARAPITQPQDYHHFADARSLLGMANFWNVATNLPFLLAGVAGLALVRRRPSGPVAAWRAVFIGTALVFPGSTLYHLSPSDATLVWDRLPIGVAFAGFFVALLAEHTGEEGRRGSRPALAGLLALAALSVGWWRVTGDLSAWVWIQLGPMLAVPLVLWLLPAQWTHRHYYLYALACYAAAKLLELWDQRIMDWSAGLVSGHSLKHLAAAAGVAFFCLMLARRRPVEPPAR